MTDKYIFLDIDGVLNSARSIIALGAAPFMDEPQNWQRYFDPLAVALMQRLVKETGAKVVLSSSWRLSSTPQEISNLAVFLDLPIIDCTPHMPGGERSRGREIEAWLNLHGICQINGDYVIIDDYLQFLPEQRLHTVHVDGENGFNASNWYEACHTLGANPPEMPLL